jgi:ATP-binding cassette subfamily B protein
MSKPQSEIGPITVSGHRPASGPFRFGTIFAAYAGAIGLGLWLLLLNNIFSLAIPRLINDAVEGLDGPEGDSTLLGHLGFEMPGMGILVGAIVVAAILGATVRIGSRVVVFNIGRDVERDLRRALFFHLSTLSATYFARNTVGDLMSRLTNDLTNIRLMAGFAVLNILNAVFIYAGTLPLMFAIDVKLTLLSLLPLPAVLALTQAVSRQMHRRVRENQAALGELTAHVQENLIGTQVVRAFSQQAAEVERFSVTNQKAYRAAMRLSILRMVMFPLTGLVGALGTAIALYVGGVMVAERTLTVGQFVEFNARLLQLTWPTMAMGFVISVYQRGKASLERINDVFAARPDIVDGPHKGRVAGSVVARDLSLTYPGSHEAALEDVNFTLGPGQTLGVVGKSGSGKTTLVRALCRLFPPSSGDVEIDGVPMAQWDLEALRQGVAVVPDDGFLFSVSVRDNLAFGHEHATDEEVDEAIVLADLSRDVAAFPEGLATLVGERGVTLSGGQKQRVSLARALLARPRLLILDDSLSAVDAQTESRIIASLEKADASLVIVTHRLSAIRHADEILVLDQGRVAERGRHADLMEMGGIYADLWGEELLRRALDDVADPSAVEGASP